MDYRQQQPLHPEICDLYQLVQVSPLDAPRGPGVYLVMDEDVCLYVGQADNLRQRICGHHASLRFVRKYVPSFSLFYKDCSDAAATERLHDEAFFIGLMRPLLNHGAVSDTESMLRHWLQLPLDHLVSARKFILSGSTEQPHPAVVWTLGKAIQKAETLKPHK